LHFLEGPSQAVERILTKLSAHNDFKTKDSFLKNISQVQSGRIVYMVEERPQRIYSEWYSCMVQEKRSSTEDISIENCKDVVYDVSAKLIELGKLISTQASPDLDIQNYAGIL